LVGEKDDVALAAIDLAHQPDEQLEPLGGRIEIPRSLRAKARVDQARVFRDEDRGTTRLLHAVTRVDVEALIVAARHALAVKLADGTEEVGLGRLVGEHVAEVDVVGDELGEGVVREQVDRAVEPDAKSGSVELASLDAHLVPIDVDLPLPTHRSNSAFARAKSNAS